jgi:hypothetical protein
LNDGFYDIAKFSRENCENKIFATRIFENKLSILVSTKLIVLMNTKDIQALAIKTGKEIIFDCEGLGIDNSVFPSGMSLEEEPIYCGVYTRTCSNRKSKKRKYARRCV